MASRDAALARLLLHARHDPEVLAVLLFGSAARGEATPQSDVDVCLILTPSARRPDPATLSAKRLEYAVFEDLDVQVFQQLPLYIRRRVLKDARPLFVRDEDQLYELAFRTVQAFEDFRHVYQAYLDEVARGGS